MFKKFQMATKAMVALIIMGFMIATPAKAQVDEIDAFLEAQGENSRALTGAYLAPLATGLSTGLNSGWNTKAAPTRKLGFSLQVRTALSAVPSSAQMFDANTIGLQNVTVSPGISSTIAGDDTPGQTITDNTGTYDPIQVPQGSGFSYVPAAMIQANIGLVANTDITIRFVPETEIPDYGDMSVFGGGIKHGISQYLPNAFPLDISIMAGFTQIDLNGYISKEDDQIVETKTSSYVVNALVGKSLPLLSLYAGAGIQGGSIDVDMLGEYDVDDNGTIDYTNPISLSIDSDAKAQVLAGFQLKVSILRIYGEVTLSEYTTYNAGVGIGFGK